MKDSELTRQSVELSVCIVEYYKWLVYEKKEFVMSKQLLKSGTSVGANIHEAFYGVSKADFISKMQIALKECAESEYWLIILKRTNYFDIKFNQLENYIKSLKKMLISTLNTSKKSFNE